MGGSQDGSSAPPVSSTFSCAPLPCNMNVALEEREWKELGTCGEVLTSGQNCTPVCKEGYTASGTETCVGETLDSGFQCTPSPCEMTIHGLWDYQFKSAGTCQDITPHGYVCSPICSDGYERSGRLECSYGKWDSNVWCVEKSCDTSTIAPVNGNKGDCSRTLHGGSACSPECDAGYAASGDVLCSKGELTNTFQCVVKTCEGCQDRYLSYDDYEDDEAAAAAAAAAKKNAP